LPAKQSRLRVRIDSLAMSSNAIFSPVLRCPASVNEIFLKQPRRQRWRRKPQVAAGMPKKNTSCRDGKIRDPKTSGKVCQAMARKQKQIARRNPFAVARSNMLYPPCLSRIHRL